MGVSAGAGTGLGGLLFFTAQSAFGETVKWTFAGLVGPPTAPPVSSSPPTTAPPPPCLPLDVQVSSIGTGRTPCGPGNYIKVYFEGNHPPEGWAYWTFAIAESGVRRYPSFAPRLAGGREYHAEFVTGSEPRYEVYVFLLDTVAVKAVQGYVDARAGKGGTPGDGNWSIGLNLTDLGGCHLQKARSLVPGPCASRDEQASRNPKMATPGRPASPVQYRQAGQRSRQ